MLNQYTVYPFARLACSHRCPCSVDGRCTSTILCLTLPDPLHSKRIVGGCARRTNDSLNLTLCSRSRCGAREAMRMTVGCKPTSVAFRQSASAERAQRELQLHLTRCLRTLRARRALVRAKLQHTGLCMLNKELL